MTWAALRAFSEGGSIAAVESSFLGSLILAPYLRLDSAVGALAPSDFSQGFYGEVFSSIMRCPHPEAVMVLHDLEGRDAKAPQGSYGWATVISSILDDPLAEGDAATEAAKAIRTASVERAILARRGAKP